MKYIFFEFLKNFKDIINFDDVMSTSATLMTKIESMEHPKKKSLSKNNRVLLKKRKKI